MPSDSFFASASGRTSSHRRRSRSAASNGATRRSSWPACKRASAVTSSSRWRSAVTLLLRRATNSSRRSAGRSRKARPWATLETTPRLPRRSCAACCQRSARLLLQLAHVGERALEIVDGASRLDALELEVALRALAHRLAHLLGELHARLGEDLGRQFRMRRGEALELGDEAAVQAAPFARHVVQVVALLPALQAVRFGIARLGRIGDRLARERGQDAGERFQPLRQVVLELDARQRVARGQLRVGGDRRAPGGDQRRRGRTEVRAQRVSPRRQCLVRHRLSSSLRRRRLCAAPDAAEAAGERDASAARAATRAATRGARAAFPSAAAPAIRPG